MGRHSIKIKKRKKENSNPFPCPFYAYMFSLIFLFSVRRFSYSSLDAHTATSSKLPPGFDLDTARHNGKSDGMRSRYGSVGGPLTRKEYEMMKGECKRRRNMLQQERYVRLEV